MRLVPRRLVAVASAMALSAGLLAVTDGRTAQAAPDAAPPAATPITPAAQKSDKTSKKEKRRSKGVKTPKLKWYSCYGSVKCATVKVPLDYDKPKGKKVRLAVVKHPATNPKKKVGTLFVNPGGPGASGTEVATFAEFYLSASLLERFDVVGFDPRGVAFSDNVRCFSSVRKSTANQNVLNSLAFPYGAKEETKFRKAYDALAKGCSTTAKPLSGAMSTAEVARDMDVLRRGVGDSKLSYLGFSYGSYLGEVYANLYPDRVRAIAIDGVLDPVKWTGTKKTQKIPFGDRVGSAAGSSRALREVFVRCDRAGVTKCSFADGNPVAKFDQIARQLRKAPLVEIDEETGERYVTTYADVVGTFAQLLYYDGFGPDLIADISTSLYQAMFESSAARSGVTRQASVKATLTEIRARIVQAQQQTQRRRYGFPYDNSWDANQTVACTDSRNSRNLADYAKLGAAADQKAPYFGRFWMWGQASCSSKKWTVKDEDAYRGPFTKRTANPVLIVGNYWDPATSYAGAVATSKRMPNSRLLSSSSWGHTAYWSSECIQNSMDRYLIGRVLPAKGAVCQGDYQPFTEDIEGDSTTQRAQNLKIEPRYVGGPALIPGMR